MISLSFDRGIGIPDTMMNAAIKNGKIAQKIKEQVLKSLASQGKPDFQVVVESTSGSITVSVSPSNIPSPVGKMAEDAIPEHDLEDYLFGKSVLVDQDGDRVDLKTDIRKIVERLLLENVPKSEVK